MGGNPNGPVLHNLDRGPVFMPLTSRQRGDGRAFSGRHPAQIIYRPPFDRLDTNRSGVHLLKRQSKPAINGREAVAAVHMTDNREAETTFKGLRTRLLRLLAEQ